MNRNLSPPRGLLLGAFAAAVLVLAMAPPTDAELRIVGPDRVGVNQEVRLVVEGLETPPKASTLTDFQEWAGRLVLAVDSPPDAIPATDTDLGMGLGTGVRLRIYLTPDKPGVYVLVLVDPQDPSGVTVATHRITAGDSNPPDPTPGPGPQPTPGPNPHPQPSESLRQATTAIRSLQMAREHATKLAKLYSDAARLVESAPAAIAAGTQPEIATTAELRQWLITHGRELGLQGQYAGLADAVDRFLGQQLGTAIRNVTEADAVALRGLAWAIWETG